MIQCLCLALATLMLFFAQPAAPAKTYSAQQFNQAISVQQDGSLLVKETVIFTSIKLPVQSPKVCDYDQPI